MKPDGKMVRFSLYGSKNRNLHLWVFRIPGLVRHRGQNHSRAVPLMMAPTTLPPKKGNSLSAWICCAISERLTGSECGVGLGDDDAFDAVLVSLVPNVLGRGPYGPADF